MVDWPSWLECRTYGINQRVVPRIRDPALGANSENPPYDKLRFSQRWIFYLMNRI
jgi:hypothetical protein